MNNSKEDEEVASITQEWDSPSHLILRNSFDERVMEENIQIHDMYEECLINELFYFEPEDFVLDTLCAFPCDQSFCASEKQHTVAECPELKYWLKFCVDIDSDKKEVDIVYPSHYYCQECEELCMYIEKFSGNKKIITQLHHF